MCSLLCLACLLSFSVESIYVYMCVIVYTSYFRYLWKITRQAGYNNGSQIPLIISYLGCSVTQNELFLIYLCQVLKIGLLKSIKTLE